MKLWYILAIFFLLPIFIDSAFAQQIVSVNQTTACFLNYSAGLDIWENCGLDEDYLQTALLPWEWITGGNFSLVIVSIFTLVSFAFLMTGVTIGILIWYIIIHQPKEYSG